MPIVTVNVNDQDYQVACEDGQEGHLANMADYVDKRVAQLADELGQVGEARLILMASLLIADELSDAMDEVDALRSGSAPDDTSATYEHIASRIENIAARLETN